MNPEKQRKMLILFLIHDQESQFTAHIIYDLLTDQTFLFENEKLADVLFNSLHWKIQKIFKISNNSFENQKKKLENININDIPYESKILSLNTSEYVKAKAIEKLKEINGSKENSIKAQQWLEVLKIPFGIYKKEKIIDFFNKYQNKMENFISTLALKVSDYESIYLNDNNQIIFECYNDIINEFHSNIYISENIYNKFLQFLESIYSKIKDLIKNENIINEINNENENEINNEDKNNIQEFINNSEIKDLLNDKFKIFLENSDNSEDLKSPKSTKSTKSNKTNKSKEANSKELNISDMNDIINEENINEFKKELEVFKKIKNELYNSEILNKSNLKLMIDKLNEIENKINKKLLKNIEENNESENEDEEDDYDQSFEKFNIKNLDEIKKFIIEWTKFKEDKKDYMLNVDKTLNECTYGQVDAKIQMKRIIGQWMNGVSKGQCIGLCGPPGVGKTTLCKNGLANSLKDDNGESRPFAFLPLGGATNGSILEGHHYTYLGSTWGKICDVLMETKCMNPIIYIDELDKVSKTEHGREIISILTHMTDQSQNKEFYDKYFASVPIDLSQVLFIFSYNHRDNIDSILLDRIQEINIEPLSMHEKLIITKNYIYPEINKNIGFSQNEINVSDEIINNIIQKYTHEAGLRKLNELMYDLFREINLNKIYDDSISYPFEINWDFVKNVFKNHYEIQEKKINDSPKVGLVNGLYATTSGLGGLTIIQAKKTHSDKKFGLEKLTGSQGDVMKESMDCAFTVLNNILETNIKDEFHKNNEKFGIHIHCPEAATPKDGPSAGLAITLCLISLVTKIPVKNDVAMTGEIDLEGKAHTIGGLYSKIQGALNAGAKLVLIPRSNDKDLMTIFNKEQDEINSLNNNNNIKNKKMKIVPSIIIDENTRMFRNCVTIKLEDHIHDILKYALVDHDIQFNDEL